MAISGMITGCAVVGDESLVRQLAGDVTEIFSTMVGLTGMQHVCVPIEQVVHLENSISSLVGLAGVYNGVVTLHMPSTFAVQVTGRMLGIDVNENDGDVNDAIGEIANMIAGSFKQLLTRRGHGTYLSTPSVVFGKKYEINLGNSLERCAVRFTCDDEWFLVAIALKSAA